jgi:hypothetical protein
MTISNSTDFTITTADIYVEILEQLGVLAAGEIPTDADKASLNRTLNMIIKAMQADGLNLFALQRNYLFINKGQASYSLGPNSTDKFTKEFVRTTLAADSAVSTNDIDVTSATGLTIGDQIAVVTATDAFWTTIANIAGVTITLTDSLPQDVTSGSKVYAFTTVAARPMQVIEAYLHQSKANTDLPLIKTSRRKYNELSSKVNQGVPTQFYFDPQLDAANLFLWSTGQDEENYITMFVQKTLSDMDSDADTLEFPQEWFWPLVMQVAVAVAPKYGVPSDTYSKIFAQSQIWYERAKGFDSELYTSLYFEADTYGREY